MKRFIGLLAVFSLVLGMALPALADASITVGFSIHDWIEGSKTCVPV